MGGQTAKPIQKQNQGGRKMFRNDTWIDGVNYWIRFHNGTHEVRRETPDCMDDNETVFTGKYEDCVEWLKQAEASVERW